MKAGKLRGAPATLTGDYFELSTRNAAYDDRLHDALCFDRRCEIFERRLIHVCARLVFTAVQQIDWNLAQFVFGASLVVRGSAQQGVETATESLLLCHYAARSASRRRISPANARYACAPFDCTS